MTMKCNQSTKSSHSGTWIRNFISSNSQVAELAYKLSALPIIGEMGMCNTITGSSPVLTTQKTMDGVSLPAKHWVGFRNPILVL